MDNKNNSQEELNIDKLNAFFQGEEELLQFAGEDASFLNGLRQAVEKVRPKDGGKELSPISDIVYEKNGKKYYFVDLVQEGGGVLGIALVGYVYVLEKAGVRFLNLGGTSAGAINTLLMAALGKPEEEKAHRLLEILAKQDFGEFQDGNNWVVTAYKALKFLFIKDPKKAGNGPAPWLWILLGLMVLVGGTLYLLSVSWLGIGIGLLISILLFFLLPLGPLVFSLWTKLGLHPGHYFEKTWLNGILKEEGLCTTQALLDHMQDVPAEVKTQLDAIPKPQIEKPQTSLPLAMVASDLTNKMKAVLPEDGPFYVTPPSSQGHSSSSKNPCGGTNTKGLSPHLFVSPASYVRASMAVPIFFFPKLYPKLPIYNDDDKIRWIFRLKPNIEALKKEVLGMNELDKKKWIAQQQIQIPKEAKMVDGGVISNFPIDVFHTSERPPTRPTFGIKLGLLYGREDTEDKGKQKKNAPSKSNPIELLATSFETARLARDSDFINANPDYRLLVKEIPIAGFDWLNFELTDEEKRELFLRGATAASEFLAEFNWVEYKALREEKLNKFIENAVGAEFFQLLRKAIEEKERGENTLESQTGRSVIRTRDFDPVPDKVESRLRARLRRLQTKGCSFNVLWVSDTIEDDDEEMDMLQMIKGKGRFDLESSSERALKRLMEEEYDLMISDILRSGKGGEGVRFLKDLTENHPEMALPATIFYISNFDPSRGTPPYAFGITNDPTELMHLVIDALERKLPQRNN